MRQNAQFSLKSGDPVPIISKQYTQVVWGRSGSEEVDGSLGVTFSDTSVTVPK